MTNIEIVMMVAFVTALGFSGWKLYAFMPNKPLEDDDTNHLSTQKLKDMMYDVIGDGTLDEEGILQQMKEHPKFDHEHFWRFNQNRLKQLLNSHYIENPHHQNVKHIHEHLKEEDLDGAK